MVGNQPACATPLPLAAALVLPVTEAGAGPTGRSSAACLQLRHAQGGVPVADNLSCRPPGAPPLSESQLIPNYLLDTPGVLT